MSPCRRCGRTLLSLCLLAVGAIPMRAEEPQAELPKASVHFDGLTMPLASAAADDVMTLMEFVPEGQTLDDWASLAAIHAYKNGSIGPRKRAGALVAQIKQTHPEAPVDSCDSPDSRQTVVSFALWSPGESFVELNVFAFGADGAGNDVGFQYAIRKKSKPDVFLQREFEPLRDRLVKMILRDGLHVTKESDLNSIRLALSPAEKSICDMFLKNGSDGLNAVLQQPDDRSAVVLLVGSAVAFNDQRLEDSAFLFYAGQLRLRFDERCFPPKETGGRNPIDSMREYSLELGAKINPAVMNEPQVFSKALARVARWKPRVPDAYSPGYEFDQRLTEEEARAAAEPNRAEFLHRMGDFATLLNDDEYFSASQVVKTLSVSGEDRLPTKEEYEAAFKTVTRFEKEKGLEGFRDN